MKSLITSKNLAAALLLLLMNPILWGQSNTSEIFETKSLFKEWILAEQQCLQKMMIGGQVQM